MPTAGSGTMAQGLQKVLADLAQLQVAPDADPDFLSKLQQVIVAKIRSGMGGPSPTGGPGQGAPPGPPPSPGGQIPGAPGAGPGPSALIPGQGMGNMDEIRRMLSQGAAGGQGGGVLPGAAS